MHKRGQQQQQQQRFQPDDDDDDDNVVLEEEYDENYEPTQDEIHEYAKWLGMDMDADRDLLWVAREGLKAPLPEDWKPCKTKDGDIYYFNFTSGESVWDHPCDEYYKNLFKEEKKKKDEQKMKKSGFASKSKPEEHSKPAKKLGSSDFDKNKEVKPLVSIRSGGPLSNPLDKLSLSKPAPLGGGSALSGKPPLPSPTSSSHLVIGSNSTPLKSISNETPRGTEKSSNSRLTSPETNRPSSSSGIATPVLGQSANALTFSSSTTPRGNDPKMSAAEEARIKNEHRQQLEQAAKEEFTRELPRKKMEWETTEKASFDQTLNEKKRLWERQLNERQREYEDKEGEYRRKILDIDSKEQSLRDRQRNIDYQHNEIVRQEDDLRKKQENLRESQERLRQLQLGQEQNEAELLSSTRMKHSGALEDLRRRNDDEINRTEQDHKTRVESLHRVHKEEMDSLQRILENTRRDVSENTARLQREKEDLARQRVQAEEEKSRLDSQLSAAQRQNEYESDLTGKSAELKTKIEEVSKKIREEQMRLEAELARLQTEHYEKKALLESKQRDIQSEMQLLTSRHEDQKRMTEQSTQELKRMQERNKSEMDQIAQEHMNQREQMNSRFKSELEDIKRNHDAEKDKLARNLKASLSADEGLLVQNLKREEEDKLAKKRDEITREYQRKYADLVSKAEIEAIQEFDEKKKQLRLKLERELKEFEQAQQIIFERDKSSITGSLAAKQQIRNAAQTGHVQMLEDFEEKKKEIQEKLKKQMTEYEREQQARFEETKKQAMAKYDGMQQQLKELEKRLTQRDEELREKEGELQSKSRQVDALENDLISREKRISQQEKELEQRNSNLQISARNTEEKEKSIRVKPKVGDLAQDDNLELQSLRRRIEELTLENGRLIQQHKQRVAQYEEEIQRLKTQISNLEASLRESIVSQHQREPESTRIIELSRIIQEKDDEIQQLQQAIVNIRQRDHVSSPTFNVHPELQVFESANVMAPKPNATRKEPINVALKDTVNSKDDVSSPDSEATVNPVVQRNLIYEKAKQKVELRLQGGANQQPKKAALGIEEKSAEVFRSMAEEQRQIQRYAAELKEQRQKVRQQQEDLEGARKAWKADVKAVNQDRDAPDYQERYDFLQEVKEVLEQQARNFNEEVARLNQAQKFLQLKEKKLRLIETTFDQKTDGDVSSSTTIDTNKLTPHILESLLNKISKIENELASVAMLMKTEGTGKENRRRGFTPEESNPFERYYARHRGKVSTPTDHLQHKWRELLGGQKSRTQQRPNLPTADFHHTLAKWSEDHNRVREQIGSHTNWLQSLREQIAVANFATKMNTERSPQKAARMRSDYAHGDDAVVVEVDPRKELNIVFKTKKPAWS